MSREDENGSAALQAFRAASLQATEAFNRQDFDEAFTALPEDIEWKSSSGFPAPPAPG